VRRAREEVGLTQSGLERRAGLPGATIAQVERGEATLTVFEVARVAHELGVHPGALVPSIAEAEQP